MFSLRRCPGRAAASFSKTSPCQHRLLVSRNVSPTKRTMSIASSNLTQSRLWAQNQRNESERCPSPTSQLSSYHFPRARRRDFSTSPAAQHGDITPPKPGEERRITFIDKEGTSHTFEVSDGDNLLDIAQANDLEMEGACGGSCACSTCHVIVADDGKYDLIPEPSDDENDMLDLAFGLTETSRLGCQVLMSKELDGLVVKLPSMTRNMQASDFEDKKRD